MRLLPSCTEASWLRLLRPATVPFLAVLGALFAVGCIPSILAAPTGSGPLRYRDQVFQQVTIAHDVEYGRAPGLDAQPVALKLDLYSPSGDAAAARPAVIWVHGGGYSDGDKAQGPSMQLADTFARLGYVSASINYRLLAPRGCSGVGGVSPQCYVAGVAAIHDAQAAVRWLRAHAAQYHIDPDRIAIGGESAGGITASGVGVYSDQPGDSGSPGYSSSVEAWMSISGGLPGGLFVDPSDAPGLLFSGTADPTVPYQWSVETANAMQAAGVPVFLRTLDGAGHVPWAQYHDVFAEQSADFFYLELRLADAAR